MPRFQTGHGYIRSLLICIVLSTGSCSRSGHNDHAGYTVEMLNGVRLQRFAVSHQAQLNPFTIEKAVTYGTDQGADTYLLSRPFPTGIDGDGILYVMDLMTAVHRFGPDGTHLGQFYQRGQGPGEFTMLQDLVVDDPYLYSADLILNRMNVFDPDGTWLRSITIPADAERSPYWSIWGPPSERRFMVWHFHADRPTSDDAVTMHTGYRLNLLDPHFQIIATPMDTSWSQDIIQIDGRSYSIPDKCQHIVHARKCQDIVHANQMSVFLQLSEVRMSSSHNLWRMTCKVVQNRIDVGLSNAIWGVRARQPSAFHWDTRPGGSTSG